MKAAQTGLALILMPGAAAAHGGLPGGGGFYSGIAHPVLAIEQFLALLAIGLLLGRQTDGPARSPLGVLVLGLGAGLAFGTIGRGGEPVLLALALVCGAMLAASLAQPVWGLAILAGLIGWLVGRGTDVPRAAPAGFIEANLIEAAMPYAGVFLGVVLITLNAAALAMVAKGPVAGIAVRVLGSWIAAIALMVLTLRLQGLGAT